MTRDFQRGFALGFVLCCSLAVGLLKMDEGVDVVEARAHQAEAQKWKDSSAWLGKVVRHYVGRLDSANAEVLDLKAQLEPRVERVIDRARLIEVATPRAPEARDTGRYMEPFKDTTRMRTIQRAGIDALPWLTPGFLVDAWQDAVGVVVFADSVIKRQAVRHDVALSIIETQRAQRRADSTALHFQDSELTFWRERRAPRCGRKCGIAIGVGGTLLAAYALSEVLGVLPGPPERTARAVPVLHLRF